MALKLFTPARITLAATTETPLTAARRLASSVTIQADVSNTGAVYIGGIGVDDTTGFQLSAGDSATIEPQGGVRHLEEIDLNTVMAYCTTEGQKLRITYMASDKD